MPTWIIENISETLSVTAAQTGAHLLMELEKFEEKVCNTTGLDRGAHTHYSTEAESSVEVWMTRSFCALGLEKAPSQGGLSGSSLC